ARRLTLAAGGASLLLHVAALPSGRVAPLYEPERLMEIDLALAPRPTVVPPPRPQPRSLTAPKPSVPRPVVRRSAAPRRVAAAPKQRAAIAPRHVATAPARPVSAPQTRQRAV